MKFTLLVFSKIVIMKSIYYLMIIVIVVGCNKSQKSDSGNIKSPEEDQIKFAGENFFGEVRQLTYGGDNAEAYWSFDDENLVFQARNPVWDVPCDQIFSMKATDSVSTVPPPMLSTGLGRTTCPFFMPGDSTVVYASTHLADEKCPPEPQRVEGGKYVWPIYEGYDIFISNMKGDILNQLTDTPGYDAEATVSPDGQKIVFTSMRTGDLELFTMNIDGTDVKQVTDEIGYDGGAFFSPNSKKLVFRASRPQTDEEINEYKQLLKEGLVQPTQMEVFTCNVDGSDIRQITNLGKANWCPYYHPSGEKIIFASNHETARGYPFNLYLINSDGTGLEKVTHSDTFDAFPMFSYDGKYLVFGSNRNNKDSDTNLFIAEWIENND